MKYTLKKYIRLEHQQKPGLFLKYLLIKLRCVIWSVLGLDYRTIAVCTRLSSLTKCISTGSTMSDATLASAVRFANVRTP